MVKSFKRFNRARRPGRKQTRFRPRLSGITNNNTRNLAIECVRKFVATTGDDGPSWFQTALKYARMALTAVGFLGMLHVPGKPKKKPGEMLDSEIDDIAAKSTVYALGGVTIVDFGVEDLLCDSAFAGPFMSAQTTAWQLTGCAWTCINRARVNAVDVTIRPTAAFMNRGGSITFVVHDIDWVEAMRDGYFVKKDLDSDNHHINRARMDSFDAVAALPGAVTATFDRPVSKRFRLRSGWNEVGIAGAYLAEAGAQTSIGLTNDNVTRYGAGKNEARYGGRPIFRLYIAFEETASITNNSNPVSAPSQAGFEVELRGVVHAMMPTGLPCFVTADTGEEVMELSSVNIIRKKPITIVGGGSLVTEGRRWRQPTALEKIILKKIQERKSSDDDYEMMDGV